MSLILDDGSELRFGQSLEEVERRYSCRATDNPLRIARKAIDKIVKLANLRLEFDSGRLRNIQFESGYRFLNSPAPYPEDWKNFLIIDSHRIYNRMPRQEFLAYVSKWEERAIALGAEKIEFDDLAANQFAVSIHLDPKFRYDAIHIAMGPSRRAGGGGIWCDGWHAQFEVQDAETEAEPVLESLHAFGDEFNTVARRR